MVKPFEISKLSETITNKPFRKIGDLKVLFPTQTNKSHNSRFGLEDKLQVVTKVSIIRWGHYASLLSQDGTLLLNSYWFPPNATNNDILGFFSKSGGWSTSLRDNISEALSNPKARKEYTKSLYEWEYETLPKIPLTEEQINGLIDKHLGDLASLNFYSMKEYGKCIITRMSGVASKPFSIEIAINKKKKYLWVALHEIAHAIDYLTYRSTGHFPTFLKIYSELLNTYHGTDFWPSMKMNIIGNSHSGK